MSSSSSQEIMDNWISSFCSLLGHEFFAEVSEDFIEDDFNLTGLSSQVPLYKEALEMILDVEPEEDDSALDFDDASDDDLDLQDDNSRPAGSYAPRRPGRLQDVNQIEQSAELLYGLIHQRFITSRPGISQMHEKYLAGQFGQCPRVYCNGARVLPVGLRDTPDTENVKLFCPSCLDVYTPPNSRFQNVDGAFFGTTFGCLFLMTFPEIQVGGSPALINSPSPDKEGEAQAQTPNGSRSAATSPAQPVEVNGVASDNFAPGLGTGSYYEPKIYGFRLSERAKTGPRMQWLRMRPDDVTVLDEVRRSQMGEELESEQAGGEGHEAAMADAGGDDPNGVGAQAGAPQRKKAPIRRRSKRADDAEMQEQRMPDVQEVER